MQTQKKIVVLSGSGISAESGISTFRGGDGLWDNVRIEDVCTAEAWRRNPGRVLEFYNDRRAQLATVDPNDAHRILAEMEKEYDVRIITQNVDDLHERAGSTSVLHLHGELTKVRPENCCCEEDGFSLKYVQDIGYRPVSLGECGGPRHRQLRPHIVFFGEAVPNLEKAAAIVSQADILLIVGTSMQVYPAASLYHYSPEGCGIYMIDPEDSPAAAVSGVHHIKDVATRGMAEFVKLL